MRNRDGVIDRAKGLRNQVVPGRVRLLAGVAWTAGWNKLQLL